jgi:uncharacterized membrane protein
MRFAYFFHLAGGYPVLLLVLWVIGLAMVSLAALVWLPAPVLAGVSILAMALHSAFDFVKGGALGIVLHRPGVIPLGGLSFLVGYPLIPWVFVMAAGFCFGPILQLEASQRRLWLMRIGAALTVLFVVNRVVNVYGDPRPWSATWLSFLNATKYPPSLDFLFMTLGPAILLLAWFDARPMRNNPLVVYGRAPLFYFLAHLFLAHALTIPFALARYGRADFLFDPAVPYPPDYGVSLPVVYLIWILVVLVMYPFCKWYGRRRAAPLFRRQPAPVIAGT